ncbi:hypothetical protein [Neobacillus kokaensis]|uniref:Lipoprotein n=1 Tax=Neobacillus kokaensis TaxID=2759023 RepID=A0ABQ3N8D5_9BACI|nr:hypothetical protein [Neobacillus kokaensis]GHH97511.1 hypothetical protein AM1BK_10540 [Neobacillus kokaensis]
MANRIRLIFFSFLVIGIGIWGIHYFQHSTFQKAFEKDYGAGAKMLEMIPAGKSKLIIYDHNQEIRAVGYTKSILGWVKKSEGTPSIKNNETFRLDNINTISVEDRHFLFGYVDSKQIKSIRFKTDDFLVQYNVHSYYWYLPIFNKKDTSFEANQFSVILKNGKEIFYPFEH